MISVWKKKCISGIISWIFICVNDVQKKIVHTVLLSTHWFELNINTRKYGVNCQKRVDSFWKKEPNIWSKIKGLYYCFLELGNPQCSTWTSSFKPFLEQNQVPYARHFRPTFWRPTHLFKGLLFLKILALCTISIAIAIYNQEHV